MKTRTTTILFMLSVLLLAPSCYKQAESDINVLERRIEKLEKRCEEMNATIEGLQILVANVQRFDFLTRIEPIVGDSGETLGYTLYFTHSKPVSLYNGIDAETPVLGVAKGEDGVWYWTVQYPSDAQAHFISDNFGQRIPTSAASPQLKIEDGYWKVSYDEGDVWYTLGKATGEDGKSFFESVKDMGDYVEFNLVNGTTIQVPTWSAFEKLQEKCRRANQNLESFTSLVSKYLERVYVENLYPIMDRLDTIGFRIVLSNGLDYAFYNGTGTNVPEIGAREETTGSGVWSWSIQYGTAAPQWILDEKGNKIQANAPEGLTPKLSLKQEGSDPAWYWTVAYGDGPEQYLLCNGKKVQASVDVPDTVVTSVVSLTDDIVRITLGDGLTADIPLATAITVTLGSPVKNNTLTMAARDTVQFTCTVASADKEVEVLPIAYDGFYAAAESTDHTVWTVKVISPSPFKKPSTGRVNLLVSNGRGSMKTVFITINPKN